jgi:uncharacterized protein YbjT (DUF2867 family)
MIFLSGATGKTGSAAVKQLLAKGVKFRALSRSEDKAKTLRASGVDVIVGDVLDIAVLDKALAGVTRALLTMPNSEKQLSQEKTFVDHAKKAGVKHIIKMSSMEAIPGTKIPVPAIHVESEAYIRASDLAWTMIKPNFFMQNFFANAVTIKSMNKFFLPCGQGKTGMSDARDVGAVVAHVLTTEGHAGKSYEITGPQVLTFTQAAEIMSTVLGRKIEYVDQPVADYRAMLTKVLGDGWHTNAVVELISEIAHGGLDSTTTTVKELLGREPTSLTQFVQEFEAMFKPA